MRVGKIIQWHLSTMCSLQENAKDSIPHFPKFLPSFTATPQVYFDRVCLDRSKRVCLLEKRI